VTNPLSTWQPHPDAWVLVVVLLGGYLYALAAWGPRYAKGRPPATRRQRTYFFSGIVLLWLASDWPVHHLSDTLFSVHMLQHMVYTFAAVPLMIRGTPGWLFRRLFRHPVAHRTMAMVTQPMVALLLFNAWVLAYHWPALVNLSVHNDLAHVVMHVVWVVAAFIMWWPVLSPLQELPHLSYPLRMLYLFGQSILPTVPASFLTFAHGPMYAAYDISPRLWDLPITYDQQIAGLLMKLGGGAVLWATIAVLFFRWFREEEEGGPDPLYWEDLEPDVEHARSTT
jgi:putative membrane protein